MSTLPSDEAPPEIAAARPIIDVQRFCKTYQNTLAVHELSFRLNAGEILGLVGPNGAGKTTTLRALSGIIPPTDGQLCIEGHDIEHDPVPAKKHLAYVPDDPRLFETLTIREHLEFIALAYDVIDVEKRSEDLLDVFDLTPKVDTLAMELSRGMRQKVAIACAYLRNPSAILLDEPLTGLDPRAIRTLKQSVRDRADAGAAIVVSSHLLSVVEDMCSHLLILHRGEALYFGPLSEARNGLGAGESGESLEGLFLRVTSDRDVEA